MVDSAILPGPRDPQSGKAMRRELLLPIVKFFDRNPITFAGLFFANQAMVHGDNDFGLAPDYPALGIRWREIFYGQRLACGTDHTLLPTWLVWHNQFTSVYLYNIDLNNVTKIGK